MNSPTRRSNLSSRRRAPLLFGAILATASMAACGDAPGTGPAPASTDVSVSRGVQRLSGHLTREIASAPVVGRVASSSTLTLTLGLEVQDPAALQAAVEAVSDPASPSYRKYLTPSEFADRFGATSADYQKVLDWANANNLTVTANANRLVAEVEGTVGDIESALHVRMIHRQRPDGSTFHAPDAEPSLDVDVPIQRISNLENFVAPRSFGGSGPGGARRGTDLRNAYAACSALRGAGQSVGILMLNEGFSQADLTAYFASMKLPAPRPVVTVPAGPMAAAGVESDLDVQMALSMAPEAQLVAFRGDTFTAILSNMASRPDVKQLSSSWFAVIDATAMNLIAQLALQGQSFFQATGDDGALAPGYFSAKTDPRLQAAATLVGGTALDMLGSGLTYGTESTWPGSSGGVLSFRGGGGVAIPSYQVGLATIGNQASSVYRNMPDVAAEGATVLVYHDGAAITVSGTSVAAPIWAGFMALVNQQAAASGRPSVGFANPALYALAKSAPGVSLNDITTGSSARPGAPYSATTGYDLSTGLGSPRCALLNTLNGASPPLPPPSACGLSVACDGSVMVDCPNQPSEIFLQQAKDGMWQTVGDSFPLGSSSHVWFATAAGNLANGATGTYRTCSVGANKILGCNAPQVVTAPSLASCGHGSCVPATCSPGVQCGAQPDGCGQLLNCGGCASGFTCNVNGYCQGSTCTTPKCQCDAQGGAWNPTTDRCVVCKTPACICAQSGGTWNGHVCQ